MEEKSYGFTLIEILITTTIMIVLIGLSFAGYRYFNEQRKLEESTKEFVEVLESAKKLTLAGAAPPSSQYDKNDCPNGPKCSCGVFTGEYKIDFKNDAVLYKGVYRVGGVGSTGDSTCMYPVIATGTGIAPKSFSKNIFFSFVVNNPNQSLGRYCFQPFNLQVRSCDIALSPLNINGGFSIKIFNVITGIFKIINVDRAGTITIQ